MPHVTRLLACADQLLLSADSFASQLQQSARVSGDGERLPQINSDGIRQLADLVQTPAFQEILAQWQEDLEAAADDRNPMPEEPEFYDIEHHSRSLEQCLAARIGSTCNEFQQLIVQLGLCLELRSDSGAVRISGDAFFRRVEDLRGTRNHCAATHPGLFRENWSTGIVAITGGERIELELTLPRGQAGTNETQEPVPASVNLPAKPKLVVFTAPPSATLNGQTWQLRLDQARMLKLLIDANGEYVAMDQHRIKASREKETLPPKLLELIEAFDGKGHRIPRKKLESLGFLS